MRLTIGRGRSSDALLARTSIAVARCGETYRELSSPWWYGARDLHKLLAQVTPASTPVSALCHSLELALEDDRPARNLDRDAAEVLLAQLRASNGPIPPEKLGFTLGSDGRRYRFEIEMNAS